MPKKGEKLSQEQLEKMQAGRKKNKNPETKALEQDNMARIEQPVPQDHTAPDPEMAELKRMVLELQQQNAAFMAGAASNGTQTSNVSNGKLTGTTDRYSTNLKLYPDPRERLSQEPRLARIAFDMNYELGWEVNTTSYTTIDNVRMQEPKFNLKLNRIKLDDDGEPTNGRYKICQMVFFEDPETAMVVARDNGLPVDETNETDFLNEMRYLRMRDWLFECFWPRPVKSVESNKRDMVIDGKQVEYYEISTEGNAKIPFSHLNTKL